MEEERAREIRSDFQVGSWDDILRGGGVVVEVWFLIVEDMDCFGDGTFFGLNRAEAGGAVRTRSSLDSKHQHSFLPLFLAKHLAARQNARIYHRNSQRTLLHPLVMDAFLVSLGEEVSDADEGLLPLFFPPSSPTPRPTG